MVGRGIQLLSKMLEFYGLLYNLLVMRSVDFFSVVRMEVTKRAPVQALGMKIIGSNFKRKRAVKMNG
jgi:hypothetical protein